MNKCIIYFLFPLILLQFSCQTNRLNINPVELCSEFYELNKNLDFNALLNVSMVGLRDKVDYNDSTRKNERFPVIIVVFDSIQKEYVKLFSYKRYRYEASIDEKYDLFSRCDSVCISYLKHKYKTNSENDAFLSYIKEIETIFYNYNQIKVPDILSYSNIAIDGCRNYIEFVLYKNEEKRIQYSCYYVKDTTFSNIISKDFFNKLSKFDNNWYYYIRN